MIDYPATDWEKKLAPRIAAWRTLIPTLNKPLARIDFESRSARSLLKYGSWMYSKHPTTQIMCLQYKLPGYDQPKLWHMAYPQHLIDESEAPEDLFAFILAGGLVEAHNSFFERCMWQHIMVAQSDWPKIRHLQWRCSAAKASAASIPRSLEDAAYVMNLSVQKDTEGRRIMLKLTKPRKLRKDEILAWCEETGWLDDHKRPPKKDDPILPLVWYEDEEDVRKLWDYCGQDVVTAEALSDSLPDLSDVELRVWQVDQKMNERGIRFDLDFARVALVAATEWRKRLNADLEKVTGISSGTKRQVVKVWLLEHEKLDLPDTAGPTVDWILKHISLTARAKRVLHILRQVNRTSVRKYQAMLDRTDPEDGRARDLFMFHGAHSGRWTGKGIQAQNLPRGHVTDMDEVCADIMTGDVDWVHFLYGDVMDLLSGAIRGAIIPASGRDLIVADYAAIEARCVLWEAGAQSALDVFRQGGDIYCDMATGIYGYEINKKDHKIERQFGKQAILGLGYGMGFITFLLTCRRYDIHFSDEMVRGILKDRYDKYIGWVSNYLFPKPTGDSEKDRTRMCEAARAIRRLKDEREDPKSVVHELALMKYTVDVYRSRYPEVKEMWKEQETAAMATVREWEAKVRHELNKLPIEQLFLRETDFLKDKIDGPRKECGVVTWFVHGGFLCCELPSGRIMRYRSPHIKPTSTTWGEVKDGLRYMMVVNGRWVRTATYGGKVVENITQAIARDFMADASVRIEDMDPPIYDLVLTVHDELGAEVDEDKGSIEEFEDLLSASDPWGDGCPIAATAMRFKRYRKG